MNKISDLHESHKPHNVDFVQPLCGELFTAKQSTICGMSKPKKSEDILKMAGLRLKAVRQVLGFKTQEAFAIKLRCETTRYNNWEKGVRFPQPEVMVRLLQLFGIGPDFIYAGSMRGIPYEHADELEQMCARLGAVIHAPTAEWPMQVESKPLKRLPGQVPQMRQKPGQTLHEPKLPEFDEK